MFQSNPSPGWVFSSDNYTRMMVLFLYSSLCSCAESSLATSSPHHPFCPHRFLSLLHLSILPPPPPLLLPLWSSVTVTHSASSFPLSSLSSRSFIFFFSNHPAPPPPQHTHLHHSVSSSSLPSFHILQCIHCELCILLSDASAPVSRDLLMMRENRERWRKKKERGRTMLLLFKMVVEGGGRW